MGWKASAIIISAITEGDNFEGILNGIGYTGLEKIDSLPLDSAIYPEEKEVFIGFYKGNLIIAAQTLPLYFLDLEPNVIEQRVFRLFPEAEICALSLFSTINHWGFSIIKQGKRIRRKGGNMDMGTLFDVGQPVEEELALLAKSKVNPKGERIYYLEDGEGPYREDQVGENFIFELFKRYTGNRLDEDDETFDTGLFGYRYQSFAGPGPEDLIYCGEWSGSYTYGDGYRDSIKGRTVDFIIRMEARNGALKGTSHEKNKETATIDGFVLDDFIGFTHQYPISYFFNKDGESTTDASKPGSKVLYSGLFHESTATFKGTWKIERTNCWGQWTMTKNQPTPTSL